MSFSINFTLDGAGWATCIVSSGDAHCEITASYLSDALGDLVRAALATLSDGNPVSLSFDEEPGEFRWLLEQLPSNLLVVRILGFPELWGDRPDSEGKSLFRAEVTTIDFGKAVQAAAATVLEKHGVKGYAKSWIQHSFPLEQFQLLGDAIARHETQLNS